MHRESFSRPLLTFVSGAGMAVGSILTIRHYYAANFPASIYEGSFCDLNAFFNCDSSAFSSISAVFDVPIGAFGLVVGLITMLAVVFPSHGFSRTTITILWLNLLGVVALLLYSVFGLGSLCLLCSIYYLFSALAVWAAGVRPGFSFRHAAAALAAVVLIGVGMRAYTSARVAARSGGDAARITAQFKALPKVSLPSVLSDQYVVRAAERFEDAPLRVVAWEDFLCSDCKYLADQLERLKPEYEGKLSVVFQHFPLEAACNDVVEKDKHPGACDLSYMAAYAPDRFADLYREVFANQEAAESEEWRRDLARRYGIEEALLDSSARAYVARVIQTGTEYDQTSDEFAHGVRSTPTLLINERMVIGTFPDDYLRAMLDAALAESEDGRFIESWVD